jgi:hypothetical protein
MREPLTSLKPGDVVRATRPLHRGAVPMGAEGIFREYRPVAEFGTTSMRPAAVVDFPGKAEAYCGLRVLEFAASAGTSDAALTALKVRLANDKPTAHYIPAGASVHYIPGSDTKAQRLARAHKAVADAYGALAYALNDLKAEEAR